MTIPTDVQRKSDREVVVTRNFDAPVRLVFKAWTKSELFARWWVPASLGLKLLSCELDARVGGKYRLVFEHQGNEMAFFGTYLEYAQDARLSWTNEENGGAENGAVTTVTFEEKNGKTTVVLSERHPSAAALEESGALDAIGETFQQLDALLGTLPAA